MKKDRIEKQLDFRMGTRRIPINLQLFADGGDGDAGAGADGGNGEGDPKDKGSEGGDKSFDDVLKDKKYQSEFDKRIAKALETAKGKWETDYQTKLEEAKTEAEKLAKMNAEQKAKYAEEKRIADLEKREKDITARELKSQACETLIEKKLPVELAETLTYDNAETCNKSIEVLEKAWTKAKGSWQEAVEKEANERLRGKEIPRGSKASGDKVNTLAGALAEYYK